MYCGQQSFSVDEMIKIPPHINELECTLIKDISKIDQIPEIRSQRNIDKISTIQ